MLYDTALLLLDIIPSLNIYTFTISYVQKILIAVLLIITPNWKQPKNPTIEWINKLGYSHKMGYQTAMKMNKL